MSGGNANLLIGLAMGLNLLALASSRLPWLIQIVSLQGVLLGVMPLVLEREAKVGGERVHQLKAEEADQDQPLAQPGFGGSGGCERHCHTG